MSFRIGILVLAALLLFSAATAMAHSTKDLKKVTLTSESLIVDQIAFYLEPHVNKRVDEDGIAFRFQIWEFTDIKNRDGMAEVFTLINDQKTSQRTPEIFYFMRNADNTWNHVTPDGQVINARIFSYVNPDGSISSGGHATNPAAAKQTDYVTWLIIAAMLVMVAAYIWFRRGTLGNLRNVKKAKGATS
jgi:hypothetical protein